MRGRSPGALSSVYLATFPPSNRLIHLAGCHCPSLHGRSRLTSPQFSLYPGGASLKGCFVSATHGAGHIRWRSLRASLRRSFSMTCWLSTCLEVSAIKSMIPLSTVGWRFRSNWMTLHADLGDMVPPCIWDRRLSWESSSPTNL